MLQLAPVPTSSMELKYDLAMKLALIATLPLLFVPGSVAAQTAQTKPRPAAPAQAATTATATVTVTDRLGNPVADVHVMLTGSLDRSGSTQTSGVVRFDGLRPGVYRLRFEDERFVLLEREFEIRAGQPPPNVSVALTPAPPPPAPPPAPAPPPPQQPTMTLPPPGKAVAINVPDFLEKNFITSSQPQKVTPVSCSGLGNTLLWQIREPWDNRQHAGADAMLYVVGGEGTIRLDGRDQPLQAGSFAQVPRGSTYSLSRRGRNPVLIVLATLVGEACQ
jgi:mannose-6-phosphate isomerase-like protein (cupin superfamily)